MRRQSEGRNTVKSAAILTAALIVPILLLFLTGCGGGGGGGDNSGSNVTPGVDPPASQPPVQYSASGKSYKVVVPLEADKQFVAEVKVGDNNTISGRAVITDTPDQDSYTTLSGQVMLSTQSKPALLIEGDYVFLQESNLSASGLGSPSPVTRKIRLFGLLADTAGQETEASLTLDGTEYKGKITLIEETPPSPEPETPVPPATPPAPPNTLDPTGTWELVEGSLEDYDVPGTTIEIRSDGTFLVLVPSLLEEGEVVDSIKEFSGTWRKEDQKYVFDLLLSKDDTDFNGSYDSEEAYEDEYAEDHIFASTQSENEMVLTEMVFEEYEESIRLKKR